MGNFLIARDRKAVEWTKFCEFMCSRIIQENNLIPNSFCLIELKFPGFGVVVDCDGNLLMF